jgi:hypothetical protein
MTLHQTHLVAFAAGSVIHGVQTILIARLRRQGTVPTGEICEGILMCALSFFWQFGNLWRELALTFDYSDGSPIYEIGNAMRATVLLGFPLLFSYTMGNLRSDSGLARRLIRLGVWLRYPLWIFVPLGVVSIAAAYLGRVPLLNVDVAEHVTLNLMMFYFLLMLTVSWVNGRLTAGSAGQPATRANRAGTIAAFLAFALFVIMLFFQPAALRDRGWSTLAAMMTSVPFTIAAAYRYYQFPFMDAFLREAITGIVLLIAFCTGLSVGFRSSEMLPLWTAALALGLAFAKAPISRWVDRHFLGYSESAEEQEERMAQAIRGLSQLSDFGPRVSELFRAELEADWVVIEEEPRSGAVARLPILGSPQLWLSLGPRRGARSYMSRQLQLARRAVFELAAQRHLLREHELRDSTARAQMQALQAQINPHFLFNTLNVLAGLIHTDPAKAEHVTEDLAEIFRYALESTRLEWVRLDDELRFLSYYLEIERTRFEERISYSFDIEPGLRSMRVPPMILQPLVENAVRHGISPRREGGSVRLSARSQAGRVIVTVEDTPADPSAAPSGAEFVRGGSGIGLANVRQRLSHIYGNSAEIRLEAGPSGGTRAVLMIPRPVEVHA